MNKIIKLISASAFVALLSLLVINSHNLIQAADDTTPNYIIYEGRLLDNNGDAVTSPQTMRFSLWKDADFVSTDLNPDFTLNTGSSNYGNWMEEQVVTPNGNGVFSVKLGSVTPLPEVKLDDHKFLQVEIKPQAALITAYQLMDVTGDNGVDNVDRQAIGSSPYAKNTERIDNKKIGTNQDDLALLGPNGEWDESQIPGGTNNDDFILDFDNTIETAATGLIKLQFGNTLGKYLAYDLDNSYFFFNDNVKIDGNLIITGTINTKDPANIHVQNTDTGTNASSFAINLTGNKLILSSAGLSADRTISFPDGDIKVVGEDNVQTLTNKTLDGDQNTIFNLDWSSLKDRAGRITLVPRYPGSTIQEDGTNNQATIRLGSDDTNNHQYYVLSSGDPVKQDLDIIIRVQIPSNFVAWKVNPIQLFVRTENPAPWTNQVNVSMNDTANNPITLTGYDKLHSSVADTWQVKDINFTGSPTFTPGEYVTIKLKLRSRDNAKIYVGEMRLNYDSK